MRVAYLLPPPELGGGTKVVLHQALWLRRAGHDATILSEGPAPDWFPAIAPAWRRWDPARTGEAAGIARQDLVIATFWTTVAPAFDLDRGPVTHYCQGYEADLPHFERQVTAIAAAYSRVRHGLVVSPHLATRLEGIYGRRSEVAPPFLDPAFRPRPFAWLRRRPRRRPWIFVPGIFESWVKGVPDALAAIVELRRRGIPARVLRVGVLEAPEAERRLIEADRALVAAVPRAVAAAVRRCDLTIFPSRSAEGFGLPLLESMASGVPAVATRIPSVEGFAAEAARLAGEANPGELAEAAGSLLADAAAWRRARRAGLEVARRFAPAQAGPRLERALERTAAALRAEGSG